MFERIGSLGWRRFLVPFVAVLLIACAVGVMFYPITHMGLHGVQMAVLNLDQGATTPQGEMNAGAMLVEKLTGSSSDAPAGGDGQGGAPLAWTQVESQEDLDQAFADNEYYAALVVPSDFTASQAAAAQGSGDSTGVTLLLNMAKSPVLASSLQAAVPSMLQSAGVSVTTGVVNAGASGAAGTADAGAANMLSTVMGQNVIALPMVVMGLLGGLLLGAAIKVDRDNTPARRVGQLGMQALASIVLGLAIGLLGYALLRWAGGVDAPAAQTIGFFWLAGTCLTVLFAGLADVRRPLAVTVGVLVMLLGMSSAIFTPEMLPEFWGDWVYPWAPQHYLGTGLRDVIYMGAGWWNVAGPAMLCYAAVGLMAGLVAALTPTRGSDGGARYADTTSGAREA